MKNYIAKISLYRYLQCSKILHIEELLLIWFFSAVYC